MLVPDHPVGPITCGLSPYPSAGSQRSTWYDFRSLDPEAHHASNQDDRDDRDDKDRHYGNKAIKSAAESQLG